MISFVVPGEMRGKQRPRMTRGGHVYTPTETRLAEAKVAKLAREAMADRLPIIGPVALSVIVLTQPPKSAGKAACERMLTGQEYPTKKPDLDNIIKLVSDAMNGIVFEDDKQIVFLSVVKQYDIQARTIVQVGPLAEISR
jgi:Holliday junction resolvase RusA-like endonuclease